MSNTSDAAKKNLNNTIQPISTTLNYTAAKNDKAKDQGRNWKNKSIENTPDQFDSQFQHKRGGSTIVKSEMIHK